ncbi:Flagellar basal-body rod protein FlgF [Buchnera aphidicola (Thelaxes suberi)]|uniref:flagellar hook-basal body complex protein n=1 Tax=Buchnera aphidicola TaxID=9 RepID=UPI003464022E
MDYAIYKTGQTINRILENQNFIANNIANISTPGFKEKFISVLSCTKQKQSNQQGQKDFLVTNKKEYINTSIGFFKNTGRSLDLAISKENYWFIVKRKKNSKTKYFTRNGGIKLNKNNELTILNNFLIGTNNNIITIPKDSNVTVEKDGTIYCCKNKSLYTFKKKIGKIAIKYIKNDNIITSKYGNLYLENIQKNNTNNKKLFYSNSRNLILSGTIEESNVSPTTSIINMISNAREFEMNLKLITYCNENQKIANHFMNINY